MSKRKESPVQRELARLASTQDEIRAGQLAVAAGVTRQAAHHHLRRAVELGLLRRRGAGRGSHYEVVFDIVREVPLAGLQEDVLWAEVVSDTDLLRDGTPATRTARFAFTEMVNNAVDHSAGASLSIRVALDPKLRFRIADDGVGVFRHLADRLGLPDLQAAAFELTKGKRTTDPARHTGQGIFFTSRLVDRFRLEANGLALVVDNEVEDFAIGSSEVEVGTTVWWEVDPASERTAREVFAPYTDEDLRFSRTIVPLRALLGDSMVSRAEAKRVVDDLGRFEEVAIDFAGVREVGAAFIDEVFRVWAKDHPGTRLTARNTDRAVARQVAVASRAATGDAGAP